ncbi:oligosaccharide flippase family protein [Pseudoalteromonas sp. bablab_jr004]|uniref:oligosaccharide flippase family protein n=1 Tax=Pseudoalteromonas sp. bablab_jr004 TaxID=2755065 RepID=UPI0018F60C3F|nr:oligosaccharide flippase family protein [Pseudoalteromonas sp. bablab_jr004]
MIFDFLKNTFTVLALKVAFSINAVFLTYQISNAFGSSGAGVYFFIISMLSFLCSITNLGFPTSLLSAVKADSTEEEKKIVASEAIILSFLCSLIVVAFIFLFDFFYYHDVVGEYKFLIASLLFPFGVLLIFSTLYQKQGDFFYAIALLNGAYQVFLSVILYFNIVASDLMLFLKLFFVVLFILVLYCFINFFGVRWFINSNWVNSVGFFKGSSLFKFTIPYMTVNLIGQFSNFYIVFVLSVFSDVSKVGVYSVALRVALLVSFITFSLNKVVTPIISKCFLDGDMSSLTRVMNMNFIISVFCVLPICLLLFIYSDYALSLFGQEFSGFGEVLSIVIIGQLFAAIFNVNSFFLQLSGHQKLMQKIALLSVFVVVALTPIFVYFYNVTGAAIVYAFNLAFISLVCFIFVYKKFSYLPLLKRINYG